MRLHRLPNASARVCCQWERRQTPGGLRTRVRSTTRLPLLNLLNVLSDRGVRADTLLVHERDEVGLAQ